MPLSYRKRCEHERCGRNWSEQAEAVTRRAADLSLLEQVQASPVWGSTAVHLYVFYLSWRLWEVHLCGFYVVGRSVGRRVVTVILRIIIMIFNKDNDKSINRNDNHHDHSDNSNKEHKNDMNSDNQNMIYHHNIIMNSKDNNKSNDNDTTNNINNNTNNKYTNSLRAYAMPPSYRRGCEHERCGRSWSEQAEAVTRRAADLSLLEQVQAKPVRGSTAAHLYVFYLSWGLWEAHVCGFYMSWRFREGTYSDDL